MENSAVFCWTRNRNYLNPLSKNYTFLRKCYFLCPRYEIVVVIWYAGLLLAELTSPGTRWNFSLLVSLLCFALLYITLYFRGGFSFVKTLNVFFGVCAIAVHLRSIFEIYQQGCFFSCGFTCSFQFLARFLWESTTTA